MAKRNIISTMVLLDGMNLILNNHNGIDGLLGMTCDFSYAMKKGLEMALKSKWEFLGVSAIST